MVTGLPRGIATSTRRATAHFRKLAPRDIGCATGPNGQYMYGFDSFTAAQKTSGLTFAAMALLGTVGQVAVAMCTEGLLFDKALLRKQNNFFRPGGDTAVRRGGEREPLGGRVCGRVSARASATITAAFEAWLCHLVDD